MKGHLRRFLTSVSSSLVLVLLTASLGTMGASVFLRISLAEAQGSENAILHRNHPLVGTAIDVHHRHMGTLIGWAVLYGPNAVSATRLRLAIDEGWYLYSERDHTTEQVSYIVFE